MEGGLNLTLGMLIGALSALFAAGLLVALFHLGGASGTMVWMMPIMLVFWLVAASGVVLAVILALRALKRAGPS